MTNEENERRKNHPRIKELKEKITDKTSKTPYIFVSYKSDDWEIVLTEIVYKLVNEYGLNVYYDGSFDLHNKSWIEQMPENMDCGKCKGVLAFLDDKYATSYATLMELMHSQTFRAGKHKGLPIIPVNLDDLHDIDKIDEDLGDQDTGLGTQIYDDGTENVNWEAEKKLFLRDYNEIIDKTHIKKEFKIYREDEILNKRVCSEMVKQLLASRGYNTNMYTPSNETYNNLVKTIEDDCGKEVFKIDKKTDEKYSDTPQSIPAAPIPAASSAVSEMANLEISVPDFLEKYKNFKQRDRFRTVRLTGRGEYSKYRTDAFSSLYDIVWKFIMGLMEERGEGYIRSIEDTKLKNPIFITAEDYRARKESGDKSVTYYKKVEAAGLENYYMYYWYSPYDWIAIGLRRHLNSLGWPLDSFCLEFTDFKETI